MTNRCVYDRSVHMPKRPPDELTDEATTYSVRVPVFLAKKIEAEADESNRSVSVVVRDILREWFNHMTLPRTVVESLEADRARMKLDRASYIREVLHQHYMSLASKR
jgi:hypothetical protein